MTAPKAAIVVGGSSGIGFALARMLAEEGHAITLAARRPEGLERAVGHLLEEGAQAQAVAVNLAEEDAYQKIIEEHGRSYGRLDVLVNNAGIATEAAIGEMPDSRIDLQIAVNFRSVVSAYRAALPLLRSAAREHRGALVINTASISAKVPEPGVSIYAATKAAVVGFTHAMNKELGPEGIKSCALLPGLVATPMTEHLHGEVPAEQMIRPADVAEVVRSLVRLGPTCVVAELEFQRPGGLAW
jgi:NAD(P)-dependent dehydrogenase (short-subunit alcohol dehydrogenase family)